MDNVQETRKVRNGKKAVQKQFYKFYDPRNEKLCTLHHQIHCLAIIYGKVIIPGQVASPVTNLTFCRPTEETQTEKETTLDN